MGYNEITGDKLQSRPSSKEYEEGWDRIFGKKKEDEMTSNSRVLGELQEEAWNTRDMCDECHYFLRSTDSVPYGDTEIPMTTVTCECLDPSNCPYVIAIMEEEDNHD